MRHRAQRAVLHPQAPLVAQEISRSPAANVARPALRLHPVIVAQLAGRLRTARARAFSSRTSSRRYASMIWLASGLSCRAASQPGTSAALASSRVACPCTIPAAS